MGMKLRSLSVIGLVLLVLLGIFWKLRSGSNVQKAVAQARASLRQQGFKTDLTDFDFSTDNETAVRAAALTNFINIRPTVLLQPCGAECALVAWKQQLDFEMEEGFQNLPRVQEAVATHQEEMNWACAAAMAGPIHFPLIAKQGSAMLLVHLAPLKNLSQALAMRMIIELREKRFESAWTNLLALTRLGTAWEPEPSEISHLVRFNLVRTAWKATWQAIQARAWTEEQLVTLQREWEAPDFFKGLAETVAFRRASTVDTCIRERTAPVSGIPLQDTLKNAWHSPSSLVSDAEYRWERLQYRARGTYVDEHDLLLFYRDRELELRKAIRAATWQEMRLLPGVTNAIHFHSKHSSAMLAMLNSRQIGLAFQLEGKGLLGRAAEAEAGRRLVIAAIGLERYRVAHGSYPKELQAITPEPLKSVPVDFMDGRPLHYRFCGPDAFVLYSVGLDCVDNGGRISTPKDSPRPYPELDSIDRNADIVWPRPASDAEAQAFRLEQTRAKEEQKKQWERQAEERDQEQETRRQEVIAELAAIYAAGMASNLADPKIEGGPLSEVLRNKTIGGPLLRLDQMLTLRQIATGDEPGLATFELPISYDALTNIGTLRLLCDADPNDKDSDAAADLEENDRATNGNCRLVWNTTYDPPGKHFLQVGLTIYKWRPSRRRNDDGEEITLKGPLFCFVSTNVLQFFPMGDVFNEKGAFFHVKLAQPVGSYSLELMTPSGEHVHTITGSTTNGIVEVHWDLLYDGGKRYTNDSLSSTWNVTFADAHTAAPTNAPGPAASRSADGK